MRATKIYKKWFTLVEMLIVIVIIGILASALIPRLSQARERANDTARKAHLQQVAAVLVAYQIDKGRYPSTAGALEEIEDELIAAWLSSVPTDPDASRVFKWVAVDGDCEDSPAGQYMYTPIKKRWIGGAWFILMAGTQTEWWSNRVYDESLDNDNDYLDSDGCVNEDTEFRDIKLCQTFEQWTSPSLPDGTTECEYVENEDQLRYIYMQ